MNQLLLKNDFLNDLRTLAENISDDFICNLDKIVALNLKQNKMFKQSLVLHLLPTVYRLKYGFNLYNPLLGEIKTNYAGSFLLAKIINSSFEKFLNVTVSEEEIAWTFIYGNPTVNKNNFSLQTVMIEHGHTDRLTVLQEMTKRFCNYVELLLLIS